MCVGFVYKFRYRVGIAWLAPVLSATKSFSYLHPEKLKTMEKEEARSHQLSAQTPHRGLHTSKPALHTGRRASPDLDTPYTPSWL